MTLSEKLDELKWPIGLAMTGANGKRFAAGADALSKLLALAAGPQWVNLADAPPPLDALVLAMHYDDPAPIAAFVREDYMGHRYLVDTGCGQGYEMEEFSHWQLITPPVAPAHAS